MQRRKLELIYLDLHKFYPIMMNTDETYDIALYLQDLIPDVPAGLYQPARYIMAQNGKKIRFFLTMKGCKLFSGSPGAAIHAALAIELFHNFTLIHDDIMDEATSRRNQLTVHEKWDTNTAILSGDVMMILAYESFLKSKPEHLPHILPVFTRSARAVCEGQQMDMEFESLPIVQMEVYLEMIRKKTAVLLGAALSIGAICGNATPVEAEHLYQYGENLGMAFQIRDDILDCYGDAGKTGKVRAGDILQGKKTILYIRTWFSMAEEEQDQFNQLYHSDHSGKIEKVLALYDKAGARDYAHRKEQEYYNRAVEALDKINLPDEQKKILTQYTHRILGRDH